MSLEQLLLLAFLLALPLLEWLIRAARARYAPQDDRDGDRAPAPPAPPRPPPRRPEPPAPVRLTSAERAGPRGDSRPKVAPPRVRRDGALPAIATAGDLRRAVVLAAILGRCRALAAHDPPDHAR